MIYVFGERAPRSCSAWVVQSWRDRPVRSEDAFVEGSSRDRLREQLGIDLEPGNGFKARNLLHPDPDRENWDRAQAREHARAWAFYLRQRPSCGGLILLGSRVCDAFEIERVVPWGRVRLSHGVRCLVLPHPSDFCAEMRRAVEAFRGKIGA